MNTIQELQSLRTELIREIDEKIGQLIQKIKENPTSEEDISPGQNIERTYESIYPFHVGTGIFKGKHPTGVIFADGTREDVPTWKKVFEIILKHCNKDPERHRVLMEPVSYTHLPLTVKVLKSNVFSSPAALKMSSGTAPSTVTSASTRAGRTVNCTRFDSTPLTTA